MFQGFSEKTANQFSALNDIHVWNITYDHVTEDYKERLKDSISKVEEAGVPIGFDKYRYPSRLEVGSRE